MRIGKREFASEFSQLSWPGQTRTRVAWELRSESLHENFLNSHDRVKREQELHESWEASVRIRVFSTLMPRSKRTRVAWELIRVVKREFASEFSQLSWPGQMRTRVAWELMRVEKQEFTWELMRVEKQEFASEFSQLSWPSQMRQEFHESWWELRRKSLHESFLNSRAPIKENKSYMRVDKSWEARICIRVFSTLMARLNDNKSCMRVDESSEARICMRVFSTHVLRSKRTRVTWELRSKNLHQSFLNSHGLVKREQELHESWEARVCMRAFSTLMARSNENKSCQLMRVALVLMLKLPKTTFWTSSNLMRVHERVHESWWEFAVKRERDLQLSSSLIVVWPGLVFSYSRILDHVFSYFRQSRALQVLTKMPCSNCGTQWLPNVLATFCLYGTRSSKTSLFHAQR
jgi:hypothetical protein